MTPRMLRCRLLAAGILPLLLVPAVGVNASATSLSGTDSRPSTPRIFSPTSPLYQKLPAKTPAASNSAKLVASLNKQAHEFYGTKSMANVGVNTNRFTPALYVAYDSDPAYDITGWNCQGKWPGWDAELNRMLRGVHIPDDLQPDPSSDGSVSIYNADTHDVVELWKARKVDGAWQACWGGRIIDAASARGTFPHGYGASASGLSLWGTTIRQQELLDGHIDHVISLALPRTKKGTVSWPANRTDGWASGTQLAIGQMLRLPASLDLSRMKLSPAARTIARAAQEYGIIVVDTAGSVVFSAENPIALAANRYDEVFRGRWPFLEMHGDRGRGEVAFPLDKLVALPLNYQVPPAPSVAAVPNTAYAAAVKKAKPTTYWRLDDTGSTAVDSSGRRRAGTLRGVTRYVEGAIPGSRAIETTGDASSGVYASTRTTPAKSFTVQVWFRTATTRGGKLLGFESTTTGKGARADRSLYLTDDGRLVFGTYSTVMQKVVSPASYNDGAWHRATVTQGSTGTRLYVDGELVATGTATKAQAGSGYWRLGGGNLDAWPLQPASGWVAGALDEFAYYESVLAPEVIAAQYRAAS